MSQTRHEPVGHAAHGGQAAALSQTAAGLRGLFWACQGESQKHAGFLACLQRMQRHHKPLSRSARMLPLSLLQGGPLIALMMEPHGENDPDPHIGKRSDSHRMAFALCSLAEVLVSGPRFTLCALPSELMQSIPQGFDTAQATMRFGVGPALKQDGRGSTQSLQEAFILVAASIIADFGKPPRGQPLAGTRQARKERLVLMGQKKRVNLLVCLPNLLDPRQQLTRPDQHQPRFRTGGHGLSLQMGLMQPLENRSRDRSRMRMLGLSKGLLDLFDRSGHRRLWGGRGLQEQQCALLVQFGKQIQGDWVIGFEASRELIDQARLHLDQGVLIAREHFQLRNLLALWGEAMQVGKVGTACLGQQVRINQIGLGSRGGSTTINRARIDRVDWPASLQQMSNQQAMGGLNDADQLFFRRGSNDLLQERVQFGQSLRRVTDTQRTDLMTFFIKDQAVMMIVSPITTGVPQKKRSSLQTCFLSRRALLLWQTPRDSLIIGFAQERGQGSASFLNRSNRVERLDFPWRLQQLYRTSVLLFRPCVERVCS